MQFYKDYVEPLAREVEGKNSNRNARYTPNPGGLYKAYLAKKTALRTLMIDPNKKADAEMQSNGDALDFLDRHKIAACFTAAVAELRLLSSENEDDQLEDGMPYSLWNSHRLNEQLAVLCGMNVLIMYMGTEVKGLNESCIDDIRKALGGGFKFPRAITGKGCLDSIVRALYFSNAIYGINPVLLAVIYYLLEQYFYKECNIILN